MSLPPAMPWVKLHTSYLEDTRFARLDDAQKWRWVQLLMLAGKLDAGGNFIEHGQELSDAEIAWKLRLQVEQLRSDLEALTSASLVHQNGHGLCLSSFEDEQGPAQADKRAAWKERQKKHRNGHAVVTGDNPVTNAGLTPLESESESEEKSEENESSSSSESATTTLTTNCLPIFKALGASPVQIKYLEKTIDIRPADIWAMAAMTWNNPKIRKPAFITLQNILSGERASADWYAKSSWSSIPVEIRKSGGLVIQGQEKIEAQFSLVATRNPELKEADRIWEQVKEDLKNEMGNGTFKHWIEPAQALDFAQDRLTIGVPNVTAQEWLEQRSAKLIDRLLLGITNSAATVHFVVQEETNP